MTELVVTQTFTTELPAHTHPLEVHDHPFVEHTHPLEAHEHVHEHPLPEHTHALEVHSHALPEHEHPIEFPAVVLQRHHITLAAYDSRNKDAADHCCDGTADDDDMNNAIADLATGGECEVELAAGTYKLANQVIINKSSAVFGGHGRGTVLEPTNTFPHDTHMLKVYGDDDHTLFGVEVRNLRLSGSNTAFANMVHGLWFSGEVGIVDNLRVWQLSGDGLWIRNTPLDNNLSKTRFTNMDLSACGRHGLNAQSGDNHFSDSIFRANADCNIYGSFTGCEMVNCHVFASTENKAGTQTLYGMRLFSSDRNYFTNTKFEHARKSVVWLDGNPNGGSANFVNCPVRNGSGEGAGLHPQVLVNRTGGAFWILSWSDSRFDADVGLPSWNIQIGAGAVRSGRFAGNTYSNATVGTVTPFTPGTSGIGYRSAMDGQGVTDQDPNLGGDWKGKGSMGLRVRQLGTTKIWNAQNANEWI
jgi:hypothetical protein